ncbi:MAG TPA: hypothetical protein VIU93_10090 [Gallionellaceae bacterium]
MFRKIFVLSLIALTVAGCAGTKAPVARKPGSFTSLTFPVSSDQWRNGQAQLAINNKRGCGEFAGNILPATADKDFTLDIEGGRDIFFHVSREGDNISCNEFGLFYAAKGNEYTLSLKMENQQCVVSMVEKTPSGAQNRIKTYPAYASTVDTRKVCLSKDMLY